jgi:hypothetical protein
MSKQSPQNQALRNGGFQTKNANFDSTCKVCQQAIRGKAPKCPVVAVKIPTESRPQNWIHATCVDVNIHLHPETKKPVSDSLSAADLALFGEGKKAETPPPSEKKKTETPPKESKKPKSQPKVEVKPLAVGSTDDAGGAVLAGLVAPHLIGMVSDHVGEQISQGLADLSLPRPLVVQPLGETDEVKVGLAHPCFDHLLEMGRIRTNTLASGPAGSGKTFAAEQVFNTLRQLPESQGGFASDSVRFTVLSCHNEMMPSDIVGPMIPNIKDGSENHRMTEVVKTYRDGGVLVFDEFDRLMGGTAVAANMALANETWAMPDGTVVHRSPDLFILATANTLGQGRGRSPYGAAEVLDGATLNRFAGGVIHWGYDRAFERQLISDDAITSFFHDLRSKADNAGLYGRIISPRHMLTALKQKQVLGWDMERIRRVAVADWSEKDLKTVGFEDAFISSALQTNGGAA